MTNTLHQQEGRCRVVVDTNLWISFMIGKRLSRLLTLFENDSLELVTTSLLITEITSVSLRDKFRKYFPIEDAMLLLTWMSANATSVTITDIPVRCRDPKDDYLLELAVQAKAIYLVSGDSDLLDLGNIGDCRIMTVAQFEAEWLGSED